MNQKSKINPPNLSNSLFLLASGLHVEIDKSTGTFIEMDKLKRFKFSDGFVCYAQNRKNANKMHQEAKKFIKNTTMAKQKTP